MTRILSRLMATLTVSAPHRSYVTLYFLIPLKDQEIQGYKLTRLRRLDGLEWNQVAAQ